MAESKQKKNTEQKPDGLALLDLNLSDEQKKITVLLLNEGAKIERQGIIKVLEPYKGQSVDVDSLIDALSKVGK